MIFVEGTLILRHKETLRSEIHHDPNSNKKWTIEPKSGSYQIHTSFLEISEQRLNNRPPLSTFKIILISWCFRGQVCLGGVLTLALLFVSLCLESSNPPKDEPLKHEGNSGENEEHGSSWIFNGFCFFVLQIPFKNHQMDSFSSPKNVPLHENHSSCDLPKPLGRSPAFKKSSTLEYSKVVWWVVGQTQHSWSKTIFPSKMPGKHGGFYSIFLYYFTWVATNNSSTWISLSWGEQTNKIPFYEMVGWWRDSHQFSFQKEALCWKQSCGGRFLPWEPHGNHFSQTGELGLPSPNNKNAASQAFHVA